MMGASHQAALKRKMMASIHELLLLIKIEAEAATQLGVVVRLENDDRR